MRLDEVIGVNRLADVLPKYIENLKIMLEDERYLFRSDERHEHSITAYFDVESEDTTFSIIWQEIEKRTEERTSVYGNGNALTAWVDHSWVGFPKRSMSYFATQSRSHANNFGLDRQAKLIIPADSVSSFGWTSEDFNTSKKAREFHGKLTAIRKFYFELATMMVYGESELGQKLAQLFLSKDIDLTDKKLRPNKIGAIIQVLDQILTIKMAAKSLADKRIVNSIQDFKSELRQVKANNISDFLADLTPEKHGSKVYHSLAEIPANKKKDDEIWFEGPYLAIHWYSEDTIEDLKLIVSGKATQKPRYLGRKKAKNAV